MPARRVLLLAPGPAGRDVPVRPVAAELAARGWEVVLAEAASPVPGVLDGVRLVTPEPAEDDAAAFAALLDETRPAVAHVFGPDRLAGAALDALHARGIRTTGTVHDVGLVCPGGDLVSPEGLHCDGPPAGRAGCASCAGAGDDPGHADRHVVLRERVLRVTDHLLAGSQAVRRTLVAAGLPAGAVDVLAAPAPGAEALWAALGRDRRPGRVAGPLTVACLVPVGAHRDVAAVVEAAQQVGVAVRVVVAAELPPPLAAHLRRLDRRGVVELAGAADPAELLADADAAVVTGPGWGGAATLAALCLAARVPVTAIRRGGNDEVVRHEADGLLLDALDPVDLAAVLGRLTTEDGLLERLQEAIGPPMTLAAYADALEARLLGERGAAPEVAVPVTVAWTGEYATPSSLATINAEVTSRLPGLGIDLQRRPLDATAVDRLLPRPPEVEVRQQWPPDFRPARSGRLAIVQPWEFGAIPADWPELLNRNADEVWVPSEHNRRMYLDGGLDPDRVHVVPAGVDLQVFTPAGAKRDLGLAPGTRVFLFMGPPMIRKGSDLMLAAWQAAFAGREDVVLVWKDVAVTTTYRAVDRGTLVAAAADPANRIVHLTDDASREGVAELLRAADVYVAPYRGEGFGMPVLEAMACGVPVLCTGGGPTDEFCPPEAGWRIASRRWDVPGGLVGGEPCAGRPWLLQPEPDDFVRLLREAAEASAETLAERAAAARRAAERLSWAAVAERYAERLRALAARPAREPAVAPADLEVGAGRVVLATPAWCGEDDLPALLHTWSATTSEGDDVALVLVADPEADGGPEVLEARVLACGADLEHCAEITVHLAPNGEAGRDMALHAAADAYVPLHAACAGHVRAAAVARNAVVDVAALPAWLAGDRAAV